MPIPNIFFNTQSSGGVPIATNIKNRIAIIGQFSRGAVGVPSYALGDSDVENRYGLDESPGSLAYRAARAQGAEDFALVRVLGNYKQACTSLLFNGYATQDNNLNISISQVVDLTDTEGANNTTGIPPANSGILFSQIVRYGGTQSGQVMIRVDSINHDTINNTSNVFIKSQFVLDGAIPLPWSSIQVYAVPIDDITPQAEIFEDLEVIFNLYPNVTAVAGDIFVYQVDVESFAVPIYENEIANQINSSIISNLAGVYPFGEITRTNADDGVVLCLDDAILGADGNAFNITVEPDFSDTNLQVNGNPLLTQADLAYNATMPEYSFTGGVDGPSNAGLDFYAVDGTPLLRLIAASPGAWGNDLEATIYPTTVNEFRLTIVDQGSNDENNSETFILNFKDLDSEGYLNQLNRSKYVRGQFLPLVDGNVNAVLYEGFSPIRVAPPQATITDPLDPAHPDYYGLNAIKNVEFEGGYDGPVVTDADYIEGIQSLSNFPAHIILTDGYASDSVNNELITHAENATELEGLRIALLPTPRYLTPGQPAFSNGLRSRKAVGVAGWATYSASTSGERYNVPATAYYAGILQTIPYFVSPAARGIIDNVRSVNEVDIDKHSKRVALDLYADSGLEILSIDPALLSYNFTTGNNLSSDPLWEQVSSVRTFDYIRQDIYRLLQNFKSRPNTAGLQSQIATSIDAYLGTLVANGEISNFRPTVVNSSNNTPTDYINRRLNIKICILELFAADFIYVTLLKDTTLSLGFIEI